MTAASFTSAGGEQVLDLAREDVLAARDDHLVVAAVDEQAAVASKWPTSPVDIRPSIFSLCPPPV